MKDSPLLSMREYFARRKHKKIHNYALPDLFGLFDHNETPTADGQILTQPYRFFADLIDDILRKADNVPSGKPLSSVNNVGEGEWLKESVLYSAFVRTSAAWDSDRSGFLEDLNLDGQKETGTFVKMLALLPLLKKMGVDALYLLPIMKHGTRGSKGDMGSPYSVVDFFSLDGNLKETLTEDFFTLEEEFTALIDAAHCLGIRVLIDFIPRTNGLESVYIKDHPEWFYWVKTEDLNRYGPPKVVGVPQTTPPEKHLLKKVYQSQEVKQHIRKFEENPKAQNPELFDKIKDSDNFLDAIEQRFGLSIAPAFSDPINDPQPPWTDVTYLRLYKDHPENAKRHLVDPDTPPYILFDTIKSNMHPGKIPNESLWETLTSVLPYYQKNYGIDGARIDMAHALPEELLESIIQKAKSFDPDFGLIAEELNPNNADITRKKGYNIMIGNSFFTEPRIHDASSQAFFHGGKVRTLPVFAAAETHDTPRIAAREGKETLSLTLSVLNFFTPLGVPFINSGQEVFEKQAMNLGLDATEDERFRRNVHDPYYGKLALFDRFPLDYTHKRRHLLPNVFKRLSAIRKAYAKSLLDSNAFFTLPAHSQYFVGIAVQNEKNVLLVLGNLNPETSLNVAQTLKDFTQKGDTGKARLLFSTHRKPSDVKWAESFSTASLAKGEVRIYEFERKR